MDLLSPVHLGIILIVALLIFGPKRLPELGQGLGKTIRDFRRAMQESSDREAPAASPTLSDPQD